MADSYHRYVPLKVRGVTCYGLVDSGNSLGNAISPQLLKKLGLEKSGLVPFSKNSVGTAKTGSSLKILGRLKRPLNVEIGGSKVKLRTRPIVVEGLSMGFNVSGPFLAQNRIDQIHSENCLQYKRTKIPLYTRKGAHSIQGIEDPVSFEPLEIKRMVYLNKDIVVKPQSIHLVYLTTNPNGKPDSDMKGESLLSGSSEFANSTDLHAPKGVLGKWINGYYRTSLMNTLDTPVKVCQGQIIGSIHRAAATGIKADPWADHYVEEKLKKFTQLDIDSGYATDYQQLKETQKKNQTEATSRMKTRRWLNNQFKLEASPFLRGNKTRLEAALDLLEKYYHLFSQGDKYGKTDLVEHSICTPDIPPIKCKGRPINPAMEGKLKEQLDSWLEQGVVQPSSSPWSFPLIAVPKKNGKTRWVVDYRRLNEITVKDSFPLPNIEDNLSRLADSNIFSSIDGAGAFHVVAIREQDQEKTAFSTPWGLFEFARMPFGLCNAPATYCRLVQKVLEGIPTRVALPYMDDTCIHTNTFEEHLDSLDQVFLAHDRAGLTLQPDKCQLFQAQVEYLGHIVSAKGVLPTQNYLKVVKDWRYPETVTQLRGFMGKINYYRKFIKDYAKIAGPLSDLLKGKIKKTESIAKTKDSEAAFETLKKKLLSSPILAYPQFDSDQPFILDTDWSRDHNSIGGVLSQVQNDRERVILYGAKRLNTSQANYSSNKGEIFAVIHFIRMWRYYLQHRKFILRTDHQALKWIRTMEEPQGMILRWLETLSNYDFDVVFRAGVKHANADALSRIDHAELISEQEAADLPKGFTEQIASMSIQTSGPIEGSYADRVQDILKSQKEDQTLTVIRNYMKAGQLPDKLELRKHGTRVRHYTSIFDQLRFNPEGLIVREFAHPTGEIVRRVCLPKDLQGPICREIHVQGGHMGILTTEERIRNHFTFPQIREEVESTINTCTACQTKNLSQKDQRHHLVSPQDGYPFQRISIDFVGPLQRSHQGNTHLLTVRDTFSRWIEAFPMKDTSAKAVATVLMAQIFSRFGFPEKVHSDQGTNFTSELLKSVYGQFGIQPTMTPAYNPKSNPVERVHRDLNKMLRLLCENEPENWEDHLPTALFALRTAKNRSTGYTAHRLLFGREAALPADLVYGDIMHDKTREKTHHEWAKNLRERCHSAFQAARDNLHLAVQRARQRYHNKVGGRPLEACDLVWLLTPKVPTGKSRKLHSPWTGPWRVEDVVSPVLFKISTVGAWSRRDLTLVVSIDRISRYKTPEDQTELDVMPLHQLYEIEDFVIPDEFLEYNDTIAVEDPLHKADDNMGPFQGFTNEDNSNPQDKGQTKEADGSSTTQEDRESNHPSEDLNVSFHSAQGDNREEDDIEGDDIEGDDIEEDDIEEDDDKEGENIGSPNSPTRQRPQPTPRSAAAKRVLREFLTEPEYYESPYGPPKRRPRRTSPTSHN